MSYYEDYNTNIEQYANSPIEWVKTAANPLKSGTMLKSQSASTIGTPIKNIGSSTGQTGRVPSDSNPSMGKPTSAAITPLSGARTITDKGVKTFNNSGKGY